MAKIGERKGGTSNADRYYSRPQVQGVDYEIDKDGRRVPVGTMAMLAGGPPPEYVNSGRDRILNPATGPNQELFKLVTEYGEHPSRGWDEAKLNRYNQTMRASPVYQEFMRSRGLPTDGRGVKLSEQQQGELEATLQQAGFPLSSSSRGMHIDSGGNVNQTNRGPRNIALAAAVIGGGYLGGTYLAPMLMGGGGVAGAGGGAGGIAGGGAGTASQAAAASAAFSGGAPIVTGAAGLGAAPALVAPAVAAGGAGAAGAAAVPTVGAGTAAQAAAASGAYAGGAPMAMAPNAAAAFTGGAPIVTGAQGLGWAPSAAGGGGMTAGTWGNILNAGGKGVDYFASRGASRAQQDALNRQIDAMVEANRQQAEHNAKLLEYQKEQDALEWQTQVEAENRRRFEYEETEGERRAAYEATEARRAPYRHGAEGVLGQFSKDLGLDFAPSIAAAPYSPRTYSPLYNLGPGGIGPPAGGGARPAPAAPPAPGPGGPPVSTTQPVPYPGSVASSTVPGGGVPPQPMSQLAAPMLASGAPGVRRQMPRRRQLTPAEAYALYQQQNPGV